MRPHADQTTLERTLRAHLWAPQDRLTRCEANLPHDVRKKEYEEAARCQETIRKAKAEIEMWENLLQLYEQERAKIEVR